MLFYLLTDRENITFIICVEQTSNGWKLLFGLGSRQKAVWHPSWSKMSAGIFHLMKKQPPLASAKIWCFFFYGLYISVSDSRYKRRRVLGNVSDEDLWTDLQSYIQTSRGPIQWLNSSKLHSTRRTPDHITFFSESRFNLFRAPSASSWNFSERYAP